MRLPAPRWDSWGRQPRESTFGSKLLQANWQDARRQVAFLARRSVFHAPTRSAALRPWLRGHMTLRRGFRSAPQIAVLPLPFVREFLSRPFNGGPNCPSARLWPHGAVRASVTGRMARQPKARCYNTAAGRTSSCHLPLLSRLYTAGAAV